jgi:hypothetical protein
VIYVCRVVARCRPTLTTAVIELPVTRASSMVTLNGHDEISSSRTTPLRIISMASIWRLGINVEKDEERGTDSSFH